VNLLEILKGGEEAGLPTGLLATGRNKSMAAKDGGRSWVMVN